MRLFSPKTLLRGEGLGVLALSLLAYSPLRGSWLLFGVLFLVPDMSMVGYALGPKAGSRAYNVVHTYLAPMVVGLAG
jgi:hypothetical protein